MKTYRQLRLPSFGHQRFATLLTVLAVAALAAVAVAAQVPNTLLHSFSNPLSNTPTFGISVAVSGTRVVVGASANHAYVYDLKNAVPNLPAFELTYPNQETSDYFGESVAISGTRVVVGAPSSPGHSNYAGRAFVYDLLSQTPTVPVITLTNSILGLHESALGVSVAVEGGRVAVGQWQGSISSTSPGSVHVFDLDGGTPTVPLVILTNPSPTDAFGISVGISGTRVAVGRYSGSAYVYDFASSTPAIPVVTLNNPSLGDDHFGFSVAISGTKVVVGASEEDIGMLSTGIAYVYDLASTTPDAPTITLTNPSPAASDHFGSSVAISGNLVVIGAYGDDTGTNGAGIAYVFDLASAVPMLPVAALPNPFPTYFGSLGRYVAVDGATVAIAPGVHVFGPQPALDIVNVGLNLATLSWTPTTSSGFTLQFADSLPPTNWFDAPSGTTNPVTFPATNGARFYRLFKP